MLSARLPTTERTLGDLLAQAGRARATGEIHVSGPSRVPHTIGVRAGNVVAVRIAGRFDPLLLRLVESGHLDDEQYVTLLELLAISDRPAGQLAIERGVPRDVVRAALVRQARERLSTLLAGGAHRHRDAWLDARNVTPAVHLEWSELVRNTTRARSLRPPISSSIPSSRDEARRELRRLARTLHPDLHAHLPEAERAALAAKLAQATAAYHAR